MTQMRPFIAAALFLAVSSLVAGTAAAQAMEHASHAAFEKAPEKARARANPYAGNRDATLAGCKLYARHCAMCHGDDGQGTRRAPSLRSPMVRQATPGEIEWLLRNGSLKHGMPSWSGLPEQRRWQIVAYLTRLR